MRQLQHQDQVQRTVSEMREQQYRQAHTFKPQIDEISKKLVEEGDPVDIDERIRRLAITDPEKKQGLIQKLTAQEMAKCPFKPDINKKSAAIAEKSRDPTKLTDWTEKERRRVEKLKELEREQMGECKFKPEINTSKRFSKLESNYTQKNYKQKLEEQHKRKELLEQKERGEMMFKEFKDCTFRPVINQGPQADLNPKVDQVIRGIDAVRKRKELIAKKKQAKAAREKEVFDFVSKYDTNPVHTTHTVPQPFNLSKVSQTHLTKGSCQVRSADDRH